MNKAFHRLHESENNVEGEDDGGPPLGLDSIYWQKKFENKIKDSKKKYEK